MLGLLGGVVMPVAFVSAASGTDAGAAALVVLAGIVLAATVAAELSERFLFFSAVDAPRMPGGIG